MHQRGEGEGSRAPERPIERGETKRAPRRGTNLPAMGDFNRTVIFDAVRRSTRGRTRIEVGEITGLSPQTVSNITRRLIDDGLVIEAGKTSTGVGKPRTILRANPAGGFAAGVHIDPAVTTSVVLDLTGRVVAHSSTRTPAAKDPGRVIDRISHDILDLIEASGIPRDRLAGLGVAAPGPIDLERGTVVDAPNLDGWHRVPLRDALARSTGLPILVDKDVTAAAVAEAWAGGPNGTGSFAFFYLGTGIGAGLAQGGEAMRGVSGNAGEIGHLIADPDGPPCPCGQRGCIGVVCTPLAMVLQAADAGILPPGGREPGEVDACFTRLVDLAAQTDGRAGTPTTTGTDAGGRPAGAASAASIAAGILDRTADRTARAVAVLTNLADVDRVVFGGPFWGRVAARYLERIPPLLQEYSATRMLRRVDAVGSAVGDDVAAVGAACLVLEDALAPSSTRLLLPAVIE